MIKINRRTALAIALTATLAGIALGTRLLRITRGGRDERARHTGYVLRSTEIMATRLDVWLPEGQARLANEVFRTFRRIDATMSEWKPSSPLSAVNQAAGRRAVLVPADLRQLIRRAIALSELTEGAFDPTWAALWGLWDFRTTTPHVPAPAEIAFRTALVDFRAVRIDDTAGTVELLRPGMKIGLGGIAKGYALQVAATRLRRRGIGSFMLRSGGQVLVAGTRNGRPWRVGIRDPRGAPSDYFAVLELTDTAVSTSGDYESYFIVDGRRYHHILDPRTGMPARGLRSATVVCNDATLADALSTAIMVLGAKRGLAVAERQQGVEAVLVDHQGRIRMTTGAEKLYRLEHPPHRHRRHEQRSRPSVAGWP